MATAASAISGPSSSLAGPSTVRERVPSPSPAMESVSPTSSKGSLFADAHEEGPSVTPGARYQYESDLDSLSYDPERGSLLPPREADLAPWASILDRTKSSLLSRPWISRSVTTINWILGPSERRPPPAPTSLALTLACTGGRKRLSAPLDPFAVRFSRRAKLRHFYLLYLAVWATGFILLVRAAYYQPGSPPVVSCTAGMWNDWPPDICGVNMTDCATLLADGVYRCPGGCGRTNLGNLRWVGGEEVNKVPLVIGGGDGVYRADSWVCAAGVHQGLVSDYWGGCLSIKVLPYPSGSSNFVSSSSNGIESVPFAPSFPGGFTLESTGSWSSCMEYHWPITAFNVAALFIFTALFLPRPGILFTTILLMGYAHVVLASDPPYRPPAWSEFFKGIPPALLAGYWAWNVSLKRSLSGFYAASLPLEVALWQGFGLWVGLESSTLFSKIPISRLGYGSLGADGVAALVIIIILVTIVVLIQAYSFRKCGEVRYYLKRYLPLVPILVILANLGNDYYLRIHHYLISLAGIPVMSLPNRISLFGGAFCLGFFLDGVGRWGWASIVEGGASLLGDAFGGSELPQIMSGDWGLSWPAINETLIEKGIVSVAILFDDVLRFANYSLNNFTIADGANDLTTDHYFRMAYNGNGTSLDYTDPVTWFAANQSWGFVPPW